MHPVGPSIILHCPPIYIQLHDQKGAKITAIAQKCLNDGDQINVEILKEWLQGKGKKPVTWQTLVDVLIDTGLSELAKDIEASLSQVIA